MQAVGQGQPLRAEGPGPRWLVSLHRGFLSGTCRHEPVFLWNGCEFPRGQRGERGSNGCAVSTAKGEFWAFLEVGLGAGDTV